MRRAITGCLLVGCALTGAIGVPAPLTPQAWSQNNTATTLFPLDAGNQLQTQLVLNCHQAGGSCDFTASANTLALDGAVIGFPADLWARQTTEIRPTNRLTYLDAHANGQFERVMKEGGSDVITTIYMGGGPPEKYQTNGVIDATDWSTGQPKTDAAVIACTHIQVVYGGVNITSPSTCAQSAFS